MDALPANLEALINPPSITAKATPSIAPRRREEIIAAACSMGAQGGLATRSVVIRKSVEAQGTAIDDAWPFQALLLPGSILPPVITEANDVVEQPADSVLRYSGIVYKIDRRERLVTVAPNPRFDYLYRGLPSEVSNIPVPSEVSALRPFNDEEKTLWAKTVRECWKRGEDQADSAFKMNLARLTREFNGMVRYKVLTMRGMTAAPAIQQAETAVRGNGSEMHVDEVMTRVVKPAALIPDAQKWR